MSEDGAPCSSLGRSVAWPDRARPSTAPAPWGRAGRELNEPEGLSRSRLSFFLSAKLTQSTFTSPSSSLSSSSSSTSSSPPPVVKCRQRRHSTRKELVRWPASSPARRRCDSKGQNCRRRPREATEEPTTGRGATAPTARPQQQQPQQWWWRDNVNCN